MDVKKKENLTVAAIVAGGALAGYALTKMIKVEAEEEEEDKPKYNLNVLVNPSNSGTVIPPSGSFVAGSTVTLKATPKTGYKFSNWTGATGGATTTIVMNSNKTITANFELVPSGKLETVYINKAPEGNNLILPQTVNADGNSFEVGIKAVNNGLQDYNARIRIRIYNPQNNLVYENPVEWIAFSANDSYEKEFNITWVGMAGQWRITVAMVEQSTEMILASYTGIMTATNEEEPPIYGEVTNVQIISPSSPITIKKGEPVVFTIEYMYGGSLSSAVLEAKIGHQNYGAGARFDPVGSCINTKTETLQASSGVTPRTTTISVPTTTIREDEVYDITCRIGTTESPVLGEMIDVKSEIISLGNFFIESYTPQVTAGENLSVTVSMDYQGPSTTKEVYVALGHMNYTRVLWWDTGWFDEKIAGSAIADLPNSPDKTTTVKKVLLLNTRDVTPDDYDLYAKIIPTKRNEDYTPVIDDRVTITGTTFENLRLVSYPDLVGVGGNCYIKFEFKYTGPSTTINTHCALWEPSWFDPHNEASAQDATQYLQASNGEYRPLWFNVPIHSGMEGKTYGIYMKIVGIPGADIYSTFYENKVTVLGASNLSIAIQDVNVPRYSDLVFSIDGFSANETVAISVVETGAGFNVQANSDGSGGYWSFKVTDIPGTYTLRATNSSGNYVEERYYVYAEHPGH